MGHFKDILPSQQAWIHELARAEVHPEAENLLNLGKSFDPQQLVEESTIDFLMEMREHLSEFTRLFNSYSEAGGRFQEAKIYSVAQTAADFMVFRNQIKLMVTNHAHGMIQVSFAQHVRGTLDVNGQNFDGGQPHPLSGQFQELLAHVGPFRDVHWTFQGEKVTPEQVAKFYFSEFARATRDTRRTRTGNKALLDQIKALLSEKGLEI